VARDQSGRPEVIVSLNVFRSTVMAGWVSAMAISLSTRLALGAGAPSITEGLAWMLLTVVPASVLWMVFRGAPPPTVAEVLYDAESAAPSRRQSGNRRH
jgi:hypothetical protein